MFSDSEWDRLTRHLTGDCSPIEREAIEAWIEEDPRRKARVETLKKLWTAADAEPRPRDLDAAWDKLKARAEHEKSDDFPSEAAGKNDSGRSPVKRSPQTRPRGRRTRRQWVSASILGALLLGAVATAVMFGSQSESSPSRQPRVIATDAGERTRIQLADGSTVHLNAESRLTVSPSFNDERRVVRLQGEGYFDVSPGGAFVVKVRDTQVQVLGTAFNVRAYSSDNHVSVVVAEGTVGVDATEDDRAQKMLQSRQQALVSSTGQVQVTSDVTLAHHLGWRNGRLVFRSTPLRTVIRTLERQYGVKGWLLDDELADRQLTAAFDDKSLDQVLDVVALSLEIGYRRSDSTVVFGHPERDELDVPSSLVPPSR